MVAHMEMDSLTFIKPRKRKPSRDQKMGCCNSVLQLSWENSYRDCGFRFSGPVSQSRGEHFRNRWGRSFQEHVDVEDSRLKPHRIQGPSRILWGKTTQFLLNTQINAGTCASFFGRGRMDIRLAPNCVIVFTADTVVPGFYPFLSTSVS